MKFTVKKAVLSGVAAGAAVLAVGGGALAAGSDRVAPEVESAKPADPGHEGEGKYTAGDYTLQVRELTDDGEGKGTIIKPNSTYYSKSLHGTDSWKPTVVKFSVGEDPEAPTVFSYPVPEPGKGIDCVASGTEADPQVRCETTPAR